MQFSNLWGRVPLWWLAVIDEQVVTTEHERKPISPMAVLRVAIYLSARANGNDNHETWPAEKTIAEDTGLATRTVARALTVLQSAGILTKRRLRRDSNVYTVVFDRPNSGESTDAIDKPHEGRSRKSLIGQNASLIGQKCTLDRPHDGRQTDHTKQITWNKKRSVRRALRTESVTPSDALVEAVLPLTTDGSYKTAYRDAQQALKTLGTRREAAFIVALADPRTAAARNPMGFAIQAIRKHGRVL